ncbi:hypothetical protein BC937DRAFT_93993 [Endogone sp. FLAS-F59071]|nr:hypothetical protein BC937DRAFT_93993 [Endogone sp. FLAS-F59071]|eukprot:RUS14330.1 hypothetical protein BC937DRAFT_93993 [Endogone sp. FLAS-F59071]
MNTHAINASSFSNHHALVIGTGTDCGGTISTRYQSTINDADWLGEVLTESSLCAFPKQNVKVLRGEQATREGKSFLIPYGYQHGGNPKRGAIDGNFLFKELQGLMADKILLLLNACYAGGVMSKLSNNEVPDPNGALLDQHQVQKLTGGQGFAFLSAAQPLQMAETAHLPRFSSKRYSPFVIGLSRGFLGIGKDKEDDGMVYTTDLYAMCTAYVNTRTKGSQLPHFDYKGDNFAVGFRRPEAPNKYPLLGDDLVFDIDEVEKEDDSLRLPANAGTSVNVHTYGPVSVGQGQNIIGNNFANNARFINSFY